MSDNFEKPLGKKHNTKHKKNKKFLDEDRLDQKARKAFKQKKRLIREEDLDEFDEYNLK
jgi:hypothetical protein